MDHKGDHRVARNPKELGSSHLGSNYPQKQVIFLSLSVPMGGQLGPRASYLNHMIDRQSKEASKRAVEARKVQDG